VQLLLAGDMSGLPGTTQALQAAWLRVLGATIV